MNDQPITLRALLAGCTVEVPLLQRDYAQGRRDQHEVRDRFLDALCARLRQDEGAPLNLDFIYGSREDARFIPLDGQQRLTTLFLLHWYLAWRDGRLGDFHMIAREGDHARLAYRVRPSSGDFFDELVKWTPGCAADATLSVRALIEEQPWFFLEWTHDPTIQSSLGMLDAIHARPEIELGWYERLVREGQPAITFQVLPLERFGLLDDLYVKMNARGKPLTAFENFKACFEDDLERLFSPEETRPLGDSRVGIHKFFERRMDTAWIEFLWRHKDVKPVDEAAMNLFWTVARLSLDPSSENFEADTKLLRERTAVPSHALFQKHGWLSADFARNVVALLEAWSGGEGFRRQLPVGHPFDETYYFREIIAGTRALDYAEMVQLAAFSFFLVRHPEQAQPKALAEWMRVARNLAENSDLERPDQFGRALAGLRNLLEHSSDMLAHLSRMTREPLGFSRDQVSEEMLKARLLCAHRGWREPIDAAEEHPYFRGQIGFLLEFAGITEANGHSPPESWKDETHINFQSALEDLRRKAERMFGKDGLLPIAGQSAGRLWRRALLTGGDYLMRIGSNNRSFVTDPRASRGSWRRFLRGDDARRHLLLRQLWDALDFSTDLTSQLQRIIDEARVSDSWRAVFIAHPEAIEFCWDGETQWLDDDRKIYLLRRKQLNGYHAELFSFALHLDLANTEIAASLAPLQRHEYGEVMGGAAEPHIRFSFDDSAGRVWFRIEEVGGRFRLRTASVELAARPAFKGALSDQLQFIEQGGDLIRDVARDDALGALQNLAAQLRE